MVPIGYGRQKKQLLNNVCCVIETMVFNKKNPGNDLLSHGETPHYHRRSTVSLLSSGWDQVGPVGYGRQENRFEENHYRNLPLE